MAIGPSGVLGLREEDQVTVSEIERQVDRDLPTITGWDGKGAVAAFFWGWPMPSDAVKAEVRRLYTEGEDPWGSIGFEELALGGFRIVFTP